MKKLQSLINTYFKYFILLSIVAFPLFSLALPTWAETVFGGVGVPDTLETNSPVSVALGSTSIARFDGKSAMISNPAALTQLSKALFSAGASAVRVSEEMFDEGELEYDNTQVYPYPLRSQSVVMRYQNYAGGISRGLVGDYFYKLEERVDKDNPKSDLRVIENTGGLYMYSAHFAAEVMPKVSVGGSLNLLRGSGELEALIKGKTSYGITGEFTEDSSINITLGGFYKVNDKINVAAAYRSKTEIRRKDTMREIVGGKSGDTDVTIEKWQCPSSYGAGATYQSGNLLLIGEMHRTNWSEYTLQVGDEKTQRPDFLDLTTYHLGVEYQVVSDISPNPVKLRAGYYTAPFYFIERQSTDEAKGFFITAGVGLDYEVVQIDIAGRIGRKTLTDFDDNSEYEGNIMDIFASVTYQIDLFQKIAPSEPSNVAPSAP